MTVEELRKMREDIPNDGWIVNDGKEILDTAIEALEEIKRLRAGLWRLASMEAFVHPRSIDPILDVELQARITFSRKLLKRETKGGE